MSSWIYLTNLPNYFDESGLIELFDDVGPMKRCYVKKNNLIMKSEGFIQFNNEKYCKLAVTKKDKTIIANNTIRVFIVWNSKENLSTVCISNIESSISTQELQDLFNPYGEIVDIRITNKNNEVNAFVSFIRVDYALQAAQEMNGTIIFGSESPLKVELCNCDARNLKWKRNSFQYMLIRIPNRNQMRLISNNNNKYNKYHLHKNKRNNKYQHDYYYHSQYNSNLVSSSSSSISSYCNNNKNHSFKKYHNYIYNNNNNNNNNYNNNKNYCDNNSQFLGNLNLHSNYLRNSGYRTYNVLDPQFNKKNDNSLRIPKILTHSHSINSHSTTSSMTSGSSKTNSFQNLRCDQSMPNTVSPVSPSSPVNSLLLPHKQGNYTTASYCSNSPASISSSTPKNSYAAVSPCGNTSNIFPFTNNTYNRFFQIGNLVNNGNNNNNNTSLLSPNLLQYFNTAQNINDKRITLTTNENTTTNTNSTTPIVINVTPPSQISYQLQTQSQTSINKIGKKTDEERNEIIPKKRIKSSKNINKIEPKNSLNQLIQSNSSNSQIKNCPTQNISSHWTKEQQSLGDNLYAIIKNKYPERVGKIVGMILQETIQNIKYLLNNPQSLNLKTEQLNKLLTIHENQKKETKQTKQN